MCKRIKVTARIAPDGNPFMASGQEGKTLLLLCQKGKAGVTAFDFKGGPPFRLPAYCWSLIRHQGLAIETVREQHDSGWHGRFVLHTPVRPCLVTDCEGSMSELPITIAEWPKGRETVQVRLDTYNKRNIIDVRCWYSDDDGNLKPGRSGITLQTAQLPQLCDALIKALETAKAAGLMPADDSPTQ